MEPQADTTAQDQNSDGVVLDETSSPFIGRWNGLVGNTNWEKGRIIYQWREALAAAGCPASEYADEAWSRRVGGVTGQHVGRLRRVYQRFGQVYSQYEGLYWSHFQAALDWNDAEMWMEGAVLNGWSVSQMRHQRWETMGAVEDERPTDDGVVSTELDEDFEPAVNQPPARSDQSGSSGPGSNGPREEGPDFGDSPQTHADRSGSAEHGTAGDGAAVYSDEPGASSVAFVRPFEDLDDLPVDLTAAFESFKLAILRHKLDNWQEVSIEDVLAALEALKQLVTAPAGDDATF